MGFVNQLIIGDPHCSTFITGLNKATYDSWGEPPSINYHGDFVIGISYKISVKLMTNGYNDGYNNGYNDKWDTVSLY
jgi:hypothetical protein